MPRWDKQCRQHHVVCMGSERCADSLLCTAVHMPTACRRCNGAVIAVQAAELAHGIINSVADSKQLHDMAVSLLLWVNTLLTELHARAIWEGDDDAQALTAGIPKRSMQGTPAETAAAALRALLGIGAAPSAQGLCAFYAAACDVLGADRMPSEFFAVAAACACNGNCDGSHVQRCLEVAAQPGITAADDISEAMREDLRASLSKMIADSNGALCSCRRLAVCEALTAKPLTFMRLKAEGVLSKDRQAVTILGRLPVQEGRSLKAGDICERIVVAAWLRLGEHGSTDNTSATAACPYELELHVVDDEVLHLGVYLDSEFCAEVGSASVLMGVFVHHNQSCIHEFVEEAAEWIAQPGEWDASHDPIFCGECHSNGRIAVLEHDDVKSGEVLAGDLCIAGWPTQRQSATYDAGHGEHVLVFAAVEAYQSDEQDREV